MKFTVLMLENLFFEHLFEFPVKRLTTVRKQVFNSIQFLLVQVGEGGWVTGTKNKANSISISTGSISEQINVICFGLYFSSIHFFTHTFTFF